ncbi:hypothetical protein [Ornithinimicrobium cerasi]|uniref:hypothetical protein n=1 Tax=Ornithinimicrobium cerasi TaxID=2248773 RepID=UPI001F17CB88|nr:hypothetical protein [Ornithinimicrobium cerasi]
MSQRHEADRRGAKDPDDIKRDTSAAVAGEPAQLTERQRAILVRLLRAAYPHDSFPDGPYERTADAVIAATADDQRLARTLGPDLDQLDVIAGGDFCSVDEQTVTHWLREYSEEPYFRAIRGIAVVALYDDHEVWELLGYEGPSVDQGGYLHRGFDDLDWLPDPRIEEYDGEPRPDIITSDTQGADA